MTSKTKKNFICTLFLFEIIFFIFSGVWVYCLYDKVFVASEDMVTSYQTIKAANQAVLSINEAGLDVNAFLVAHDPSELQNLTNAIVSARLNVVTLQQFISDNQTEMQLFAKLQPLLERKIAFLNKVVELSKSGDEAGAVKLAADKERVIVSKAINQVLIDIKKIESGQLDQATPVYKLDEFDANRYFILAGLINVVVMLLIYIGMRHFCSREN